MTTKILGPAELASLPPQTGLEKAIAYINDKLADPDKRRGYQPRNALGLFFSFQFCVKLSLEEAQALLRACKESWASAQVTYNDDTEFVQVHITNLANRLGTSFYFSDTPFIAEELV